MTGALAGVERPEASAASSGEARWLLVGGTVLLALVRLWSALRANAMTSLPDEIGFLGDAWLIGRGQPASPMAFSPLYPGTYPVVLAPFAAVTNDTDTLLTIARVLNVAVLAALAPALWILLGRLGWLAPRPRALVAVAASAAPGLSVAALRAWPDAFLALGWVLALIALSSLSRPGPLLRRLWFGPLVGVLAAAHARFVPVLALAVVVLVLRILALGTGERSTGWRADVLNLVGLLVTTVLGRLIDSIVDDRWSQLAPSAAERLRDEPGKVLGDVFPSVVGQTWFAIVASCGLAAVGAVVAGRLALPAVRRGRAVWCEPVPLLAAVTLLGAVGVQVATAVQIQAGDVFGTTAFDLLANGRYQEAVLAPLVALGLSRLARRSSGQVGLELCVAAVALATALILARRVGDPATVIDGSFVAAWSDGPLIDAPVLVPTAAAMAVFAILVLLRSLSGGPDEGRRPDPWRASLAPLLVLVLMVGVGVDRSERVVAQSELTAAQAPDLAAVRAALDGAPVAMAYEGRTLWATILVGWALAEEGVEAYPSGEVPPRAMVIAPVGADGRPDVPGLEGAERLADIRPSPSIGYPLALWELPDR